jgi:hypothetical protein
VAVWAEKNAELSISNTRVAPEQATRYKMEAIQSVVIGRQHTQQAASSDYKKLLLGDGAAGKRLGVNQID